MPGFSIKETVQKTILKHSAYYKSLYDKFNEFSPRLIPILDQLSQDIIAAFPDELEAESENLEQHKIFQIKSNTNKHGGKYFLTPDAILNDHPRLHPDRQYIDPDETTYPLNSVRAIWNVLVKSKQLVAESKKSYADDIDSVLSQADFYSFNFNYLDLKSWGPRVVDNKTLKLSMVLLKFYISLLLALDKIVQENEVLEQQSVVNAFIKTIKKQIKLTYSRISTYNHYKNELKLSVIGSVIQRNRDLLNNRIRELRCEGDTVESVYLAALTEAKEFPSYVQDLEADVRQSDKQLYDLMQQIKTVKETPQLEEKKSESDKLVENDQTNDQIDDNLLPCIASAEKTMQTGFSIGILVQELTTQQPLLEEKYNAIKSIDLANMLRSAEEEDKLAYEQYEINQARLEEVRRTIRILERDIKKEQAHLDSQALSRRSQIEYISKPYDLEIKDLQQSIDETIAARTNRGLNLTNLVRVTSNVISYIGSAESDTLLSQEEIAEKRSKIQELRQAKKISLEAVDIILDPEIETQARKVKQLRNEEKIHNKTKDALVLDHRKYQSKLLLLKRTQSIIKILQPFQTEINSLETSVHRNHTAIRQCAFSWNLSGDYKAQSKALDQAERRFNEHLDHREKLNTKLAAVAVPLQKFQQDLSEDANKNSIDLNEAILHDTAAKLFKKVDALVQVSDDAMLATVIALKEAQQQRALHSMQVNKDRVVQKYIGSDKNQFSGKLKEYWDNRNYQISYLISDAADYLFTSCFGRKTERQERADYLSALQSKLSKFHAVDYSVTNSFDVGLQVGELLEFINTGIRKFKPRQDRLESLEHYLHNLKADITQHHINSLAIKDKFDLHELVASPQLVR